jgi:hypothetical protein
VLLKAALLDELLRHYISGGEEDLCGLVSCGVLVSSSPSFYCHHSGAGNVHASKTYYRMREASMAKIRLYWIRDLHTAVVIACVINGADLSFA